MDLMPRMFAPDGSMAAGAYLLVAPLFVVAGYFFILLDRRREGSLSRDDRQVGLKLVLYAFGLAGLSFVSAGVFNLLAYILGGFKGGTDNLKLSIAHLIAGGAVLGGVLFALLPRTNTKELPQVERFALGLVALISGIGAVTAIDGFMTGLFGGGAWADTSRNLAAVLTFGALGFVALTRHGALSGWTAPVRAAAPMSPPGVMPQQYPQGYPQQYQQPGYPPGGGYPPQGGGGYPPQGGGGGYPPQGGGGYPPQGGGGGNYPR